MTMIMMVVMLIMEDDDHENEEGKRIEIPWYWGWQCRLNSVYRHEGCQKPKLHSVSSGK